MCGIAGLLGDEGGHSGEALAAMAARMAETLRHRGPDSADAWVEEGCGLALGHRRLAVLDLSPEGHQPMVSSTGRFVLAYNGEIYNFRDLRRELEKEGARFRGHSDTEVLVAAVERWGLGEALRRASGMFAFALWDRAERELHLVRDRLGKKPLYVGRVEKRLLFASELKALHADPAFSPEIDRGSLALFLRHGCVPAPYSIYRNVLKLPAAGWLSVTPRHATSTLQELVDRIASYWSIQAVARQGMAEPLAFPEGEEAAADRMEEVLSRAVADRMISDVPLGALLSGGIDSSLVVALMQRQAGRPVKTFTVGFREARFDEASEARRVAAHLGTEHTELQVTPSEALAVIPRLPEIYDEPFADPSQIPTFLISQLARKHVTVALSGDGGDESFGGYQRHFRARQIASLSALPSAVRLPAARLLVSISPRRWDGLFRGLAPAVPRHLRGSLSGDQVHKLAGILQADGPEPAYRVMASHWTEPGEIVRGPAGEPPTILTDPGHQARFGDYASRMMVLDTATYLPDDILTKVDRASMAVSLELRAPLLDVRVVELAWRLPLNMKIRDARGKWVLRRILERHVPRALFDRAKQGFGVPIGEWLRGPLRSWAEALLDERRLEEDGFLDSSPIRRRWDEHLRGRRNWASRLWDVLIFQAWRERWS